MIKAGKTTRQGPYRLCQVGPRYCKQVADAVASGSFKHRQIVVDKQCAFGIKCFQQMKFFPESLFLLGMAQFMRRDYPVKQWCQSGLLELKRHGLQMGVSCQYHALGLGLQIGQKRSGTGPQLDQMTQFSF